MHPFLEIFPKSPHAFESSKLSWTGAYPLPSFMGKKGDHLFDHLIQKAADQNEMEAAIIKAVIMAESGFNANAVSRVGAKGLMQLMPRTARSIGVKNLFSPQENIDGGVAYLKKLSRRYSGDMVMALAAYNAGSRNVSKYKGVPPFKETRAYITKVMTYYRYYRAQSFRVS